MIANSTRRNVKKFEKVDEFIDKYLLEKLEIGICKKENIECSDYSGDVFFIDGDHDAYYIQSNEYMYFNIKSFRHKLGNIKRKFFD